MIMEVEEATAFEAVTRRQPAKTQQTACCSEPLSVRISDSPVVTCSYGVGVQRIQLSIQTPSIVTISPFKITLPFEAITIMQSGYVIKRRRGGMNRDVDSFNCHFSNYNDNHSATHVHQGYDPATGHSDVQPGPTYEKETSAPGSRTQILCFPPHAYLLVTSVCFAV
jgi:hypothetical protein